MPTANISNSLRAGIQSDIAYMWQQAIPTWEEQMKPFVRFLPWTNIRFADYGFKESMPFPKFWGYSGVGRTRQTFKDKKITCGVYPYELSVPWSKWDEADDQLGDLRTHIQTGVQNFAALPYNFISEYLNASADLLPSISNAYDGAALFATVDGDGAARFGVTNGNLISGSGLDNAAIIHDIAYAQRQALQYLNPASRPIFQESDLSYDKMVVMIPPALNEKFQRISKQEFILASTINNNAESNFLKGTFRYQINPFLTDSSDYYIFFDHPVYKPFLYRAPQNENDLMSIFADYNNSDWSREHAEYAFFAEVRCGITPFSPFCCVKINN